MSALGEAARVRVLHVTPECAPMTKTGGLGDVSEALPAALREAGVDAMTLLPGYPPVLDHVGRAHEALRVTLLGFECRLVRADPFIVVDCPALYQREGGPYQGPDGHDWDDNALRFGVLSRAAALLGGARSPLDWRPAIVHCHDWPAGLAPVYLREEPKRAASVMTIHNLAFQGNYDAQLLARLELPASAFTIDGLEFYGRLSFLKGGIASADAVTTVSPTYAREIQTPEFGHGMDGLLRHRRDVLSGILNGINTRIWDPWNDVRIAQRYDARTLERKAANKAALQRRLNLEPRERVPLVGVVSRLTLQKGADLLAAAADALAALPAQLAVVGQGERTLEQALAAAAARHPGRIGVQVVFDEDLAHAIEAGADLFVMPSRFEPCGLNQMYSQRYGTPPVVRATGGLVDTVQDGVTGFFFERAERDALLEALRRALAAYAEPARWLDLQRAGMERDFSWSAAARRYADLYLKLARLPQR
jgi:starch synthase